MICSTASREPRFRPRKVCLNYVRKGPHFLILVHDLLYVCYVTYVYGFLDASIGIVVSLSGIVTWGIYYPSSSDDFCNSHINVVFAYVVA